jgi:hypothetical protein
MAAKDDQYQLHGKKLSFQIETGYIIFLPGHTNHTSSPHTKQPAFDSQHRRRWNLVVLGATSALGGADLEAVLETTVDDLQVRHPAAAGGLSSLGLLAPVDCFAESKPQIHSERAARAHSGRAIVHLRVLAEG